MGFNNLDIRIAQLVICLFLFIFGITGNALIIWTCAFIKRLRVKQNIFVVCLATVDFLITGYLLPFNMYVLVFKKEIELSILCEANAVICHILFTCSVQFIMQIAISRLVKICYSQHFTRIYSRKTCVILIASCPVIGMIFATPILFDNKYWSFDKTLQLCIFNRYVSRPYSFVYMTICLIIPVSVTAYSYIRIYFHVIESKRRLFRVHQNFFARRKLKNEIMFIRSQFAVFIAYLILYLPFGITNFGSSTEDFPQELHTVAMYLCFLNSCINSLLYGMLNREMRRAYLQSLSCKVSNSSQIPSQSSSSTEEDNRLRPVTTDSNIAFFTVC